MKRVQVDSDVKEVVCLSSDSEDANDDVLSGEQEPITHDNVTSTISTPQRDSTLRHELLLSDAMADAEDLTEVFNPRYKSEFVQSFWSGGRIKFFCGVCGLMITQEDRLKHHLNSGTHKAKLKLGHHDQLVGLTKYIIADSDKPNRWRCQGCRLYNFPSKNQVICHVRGTEHQTMIKNKLKGPQEQNKTTESCDKKKSSKGCTNTANKTSGDKNENIEKSGPTEQMGSTREQQDTILRHFCKACGVTMLFPDMADLEVHMKGAHHSRRKLKLSAEGQANEEGHVVHLRYCKYCNKQLMIGFPSELHRHEVRCKRKKAQRQQQKGKQDGSSSPDKVICLDDSDSSDTSEDDDVPRQRASHSPSRSPSVSSEVPSESDSIMLTESTSVQSSARCTRGKGRRQRQSQTLDQQSNQCISTEQVQHPILVNILQESSSRRALQPDSEHLSASEHKSNQPTRSVGSEAENLRPLQQESEWFACRNVQGGMTMYQCALCDISSGSRLSIMHHFNSTWHHSNVKKHNSLIANSKIQKHTPQSRPKEQRQQEESEKQNVLHIPESEGKMIESASELEDKEYQIRHSPTSSLEEECQDRKVSASREKAETEGPTQARKVEPNICHLCQCTTPYKSLWEFHLQSLSHRVREEKWLKEITGKLTGDKGEMERAKTYLDKKENALRHFCPTCAVNLLFSDLADLNVHKKGAHHRQCLISLPAHRPVYPENRSLHLWYCKHCNKQLMCSTPSQLHDHELVCTKNTEQQMLEERCRIQEEKDLQSFGGSNRVHKLLDEDENQFQQENEDRLVKEEEMQEKNNSGDQGDKFLIDLTVGESSPRKKKRKRKAPSHLGLGPSSFMDRPKRKCAEDAENRIKDLMFLQKLSVGALQKIAQVTERMQNENVRHTDTPSESSWHELTEEESVDCKIYTSTSSTASISDDVSNEVLKVQAADSTSGSENLQQSHIENRFDIEPVGRECRVSPFCETTDEEPYSSTIITNKTFSITTNDEGDLTDTNQCGLGSDTPWSGSSLMPQVLNVTSIDPSLWTNSSSQETLEYSYAGPADQTSMNDATEQDFH